MQKRTEIPTHAGIIFLFLLIGAMILGPQVIDGQRTIGGIALLWPLALILSKRKSEKGQPISHIDNHIPKK